MKMSSGRSESTKWIFFYTVKNPGCTKQIKLNSTNQAFLCYFFLDRKRPLHREIQRQKLSQKWPNPQVDDRHCFFTVREDKHIT